MRVLLTVSTCLATAASSLANAKFEIYFLLIATQSHRVSMQIPNKAKKAEILPPTVIEFILAAVCLFLVFRVTAAAAFLGMIATYIFIRRRQNRRPFVIAWSLFVAALLIPVDVYIPGYHGPLYGDKHSSIRFVRVVYGLPNTPRCLDKYGEFIAGGCVAGIHESQWMLVCN
jgi:hypothetical protein